MNRRIFRSLLAVLALSALLAAQAPLHGPHYEQVYTLKPKEGVFAYAR